MFVELVNELGEVIVAVLASEVISCNGWVLNERHLVRIKFVRVCDGKVRHCLHNAVLDRQSYFREVVCNHLLKSDALGKLHPAWTVLPSPPFNDLH